MVVHQATEICLHESKKNGAGLDVWPFEDSDGVVVVWCGRYYLGSIPVSHRWMSRQLDKRKISLLGLEEKESVSNIIWALKAFQT